MSSRSFASAVVIAALAGATGCATGSSFAGGTFFDEGPEQAESYVLRVVNNNWSNMTIYLVRGGVEARVGTVGALQSAQFRLPPSLVAGDVAVMARPLASREAYITHRVSVMPGQRIQLQLEHNLNLSHFSVW